MKYKIMVQRWDGVWGYLRRGKTPIVFTKKVNAIKFVKNNAGGYAGIKIKGSR